MSDPLGQLNANMNAISSSILSFLWQQKENTKHVNSYIMLPKMCGTRRETSIIQISGLLEYAKRQNQNETKNPTKPKPKTTKKPPQPPENRDATKYKRSSKSRSKVCKAIYQRLMLCENTLKQSISYFQKAMHIVSISFIVI